MGLFLQTALFPGSTEQLARAAVQTAAERGGNYELTPDLCRYYQHPEGAQVLLGDDAPGLAELARALSAAGQCPVMLLNIYDGDLWGYDFFDNGEEVDRFDPMPDYSCPVTDFQRKQVAGRPEAVGDYFPAATAKEIQLYLVPWTEELLEGETYACPGDQYPYGDCWQMADFTARLGFPWPFDDEKMERKIPSLPTLREILDQNLPPQPVSPEQWEGIYPMLGDLPSALDPDYIRKLLQEEGFEEFADMDPREVLSANEERRCAVRPRPPERDPFCRRLTVLAAFCAMWLGEPVAAYWDLYNATDNALFAPNGGGAIDVETLRARGMAVALSAKRHIVCKDLTRLLDLDPDNRDVYLLCRAYIYTLDCGVVRPRGVREAMADLDELAKLGGVRRSDPRLNFAAFPTEFLEQPGIIAPEEPEKGSGWLGKLLGKLLGRK